MSPSQLPDRPNLEQLKKQAKSLLHAAQAAGRSRARSASPRCPRLRSCRPHELGAPDLALHDAQSVIAREHGFASWNALREEVEARTLSFDAAVDEFIRCATGGASGRAERLLALHPGIASASLQTALVLGDAAAVEARLRDASGARDASRADRRTGSRCSTRATRACTRRAGARGWPGRDRATAVRARRESERRVSLELASGASAHGAVGRDLRRQPPAARGGAARGGRESHRRRVTSTSPAAAAISPRSSCCIASAST